MTRAMKNSGVEWIGEIPQEWETWKLKHVASIQTGNTPTKTSPDNYSDYGLLWVKPDNLRELTPIEETNEYISDEGKSLARIAYAYSTLVCCIGTVGKIGYSNVPVAFNQQINAVDFDCDKIFWKYGLYFLSCQKEQHQYYMNGNVVYILNSENHGRIKIVKPELSEQQAISNYLDKKCAEFDAIINSKQEQNKLLKEQRQSIIYEAVTKGLDKNAPMKDSGVEWIDEIPKGWTVKRLRYFGELNSSGVDKKIRDGETIYKSVHYTDVYNNSLCEIFDSDEYLEISATEDKVEACKLRTGDVLFTNSSETAEDIGHSTVIAEDMNDTLFGYHLMRFRPSEKMYLHFEKYLFGSQYLQNWFAYNANGITRYGINYTDFADAWIFMPDFDEQKVIADYLDNKCAELDRLIQANVTTINELKEYRQSVIFEAVTGKMEVC